MLDRGALVIHLVYDGAFLMFFKVFDTEGRRLEWCPEKDGRGPAVARTRPADRFPGSSSGGSEGAGWSNDSAELLANRETSDDSYEPPSSCRARSRVLTSDCRRH